MEAQNRLLPRWFERIETGQLKLPRFQRFEAWGPNEVADLLETVLRGLPAGATLILQVGDEEKFVSRLMLGAPEPTERVNEHLLDGQQRLTALWCSLHDLYDDRAYFAYFEEDEEHDNEIVPKIYAQARWEREGRRYPLWTDRPHEVHQRSLIPLRLLRPGDHSSEVGAWCDAATQNDVIVSRELERQINRLRERVMAYNIPYLLLPVTTPRDVALDVFIKMNTSAVKLTAFDIVVAQVEAATGESLHQLVADLRGQVPRLAAYVDPEDLILSTAALREDRSPTQKSFQLLNYPGLVDEWPKLVEGARFLVETLAEEMIFDGERLPTVAVLPVLAALNEKLPSDPDRLGYARSIIRRYLWRSFLTDRYERAAATRALQDLRALSGIIEGSRDLDTAPVFNDELHPLPTREKLVRAGWPKTRDVLARGVLAVTLRRGSLDFADARPVTADNVLKREYHHLFPDSLLTSHDYGALPAALSYRALNCALITWNTNRIISAKEPVAYLRERTDASPLGESEIRDRLASHLVPYEALSVGGYELISRGPERADRIRSDYERFLGARAELLADPIEALCEGKHWPT